MRLRRRGDVVEPIYKISGSSWWDFVDLSFLPIQVPEPVHAGDQILWAEWARASGECFPPQFWSFAVLFDRTFQGWGTMTRI